MAQSPKAARSASGRHGFPWRAAGLFLVVLVTLSGAGLVGLAALTPDPVPPPQPDLAAAPPSLPSPSADEPTTPTATPTPTSTPSKANASPTTGAARGEARSVQSLPTPAGMPRSQPTRIKIPRIGVDAPTTPVGLDRNQQIGVPPLNQPKTAGWYKLGPSPGEVGTAVVVGHVDSRATGQAVFFRLGALKPKDTIEVLRTDGKKARFIVDGVARYPKKQLPLNQVYGHTGKAQLRVITCGGDYDKKAKSYKDNIVVFATLATGPAK
ncbi:class F sortase [Micromonospora sp. WP24]|uniref:class F sortase n=1 Tax=Micromonospora sp. WP24 TaxID=2604469 RepID=UPI0011D8F706|nr:class F sortase [Micromonospora sp. WP24]TYB95217.1 class F sortase [Micromonospora sp. WP24]